MPSLAVLSGRLRLYLQEAPQGLTAQELTLLAGQDLQQELSYSFVREEHERYYLAGDPGEWFPSDLANLAKSGQLYFSYGANMDPEQMYHGPGARLPSARFLCRALLEGYELSFPRRSTRYNEWVAGVYPARATAGVWGVLYLVEPDGFAVLDRRAGAPKAYTRETLPVTVQLRGLEPVTVRAVVYLPVDDGSGGGVPAAAYMAHLIRGASVFGLPRGYQEYLAGIETVAGLPETAAEPGAVREESRSKYLPLVTYLDGQEKSELGLGFGEIERILGFELPPSAHVYPTPWREAPIGSLLGKYGWQVTAHFTEKAATFRRHWEEGALLNAVARSLGPAEADTFKRLYGWAKERGAVLPGKGKIPAFTFRPANAQHSVFSAGADGKVTIHLGWLCRSLPVERVEALRERLAVLPGAQGLSEPVRAQDDQHGWVSLAGLGVPGNWQIFAAAVEGIGREG